MKEEFLKHKIAYISLVIFLGIATLMFMATWPDRDYQRYLILLIAVFYFLWGVVSHTKSQRLTNKILFEYFGVSVLAALLLFLVTI